MQLALHTAKRPRKVPLRDYRVRDVYDPYVPLDFSIIQRKASALADLIEARREELERVLLKYESYEVATDETARTLDLLRNLEENRKYFHLRVGPVAAFLPRNQPLYAFTCFVVVPALMASEVHFRIPRSMRDFFPDVLRLLDVSLLFPNIRVSHSTRLEFLRERSALRIEPATQESIPITDVVIFTGIPAHADQLRVVFDDRTLFISNGAGHNPVVVGKDANIFAAVDAVLTLQLYNQGQDCAAPNAILIHRDVFAPFLNVLRDKLRTVKIGHYQDRSCQVGPISDPSDLVRIQDFLVRHRTWLDPMTPGVIRVQDAIVEPTIICRPLKEGGNFSEIFAPVIFLQEYEDDPHLSLYFENPHYTQNAMYISLYGTSTYVTQLIDRPFVGRILHDKDSVLINTHLHAFGVERGTRAYGGYGYGASSFTIHGKTTCRPTLPQRDIYEQIAKPLLRRKSLEVHRKKTERFTQMLEKNVEKLLRLMPHVPTERTRGTSTTYMDVCMIKKVNGRRYSKIDEKHTYQLLERPNIAYVAKLKPDDVEPIRALRKSLLRRRAMKFDEFHTMLYTLAARSGAREQENHARQQLFFQHIYNLLLGSRHGPRLAQFLLDIDRAKVLELLDV